MYYNSLPVPCQQIYFAGAPVHKCEIKQQQKEYTSNTFLTFPFPSIVPYFAFMR